jgi:hypothetical protein
MSKQQPQQDLVVSQDHPPQPMPEAGSILAVIARAAADPNVDVEKLERLFALQERFVAKQAETEFNAAISRVQAKVGRATKNKWNPQTKSGYADYAAVDAVARPIYVEEGFAVSFGTEDGADPGRVRIVALVSHRAGHTRKYHVDMPADGKGAKGGDVMTLTHATGSAMAYGMRYLLKGIWNIAIGDDDNDGNTDDPCITPEQVLDLEALIEEVGANRQLFLRYGGVERLEDIRARSFKAAVAALEAKRKQQ